MDVTKGNVAKIAALFPQCVTERIGKDGKVELAIDFEKLQAELSNYILAEGEERYQFTWPDKRAASRLANESTTMTLRPCREESVDFDTTENLYIEGDNLDVLKVLRETYLGKVKMIYIDPPYNTGNDFVYNDDFAQSKDDFEAASGLFDEEGNVTRDPMQRNTEANGRFHTDWLNMIYPRLKVARDLLSEDGVIFISIDDNELENLRKICDEIFGEKNFIGNFIWRKKSTSTNVANALVSAQCDYQLCYGRNLSVNSLNRRITKPEDRKYPYEDVNGRYRTSIIEKKDSGSYARQTMKYQILGVYPREGKRWQIGEGTARKLEKENRFINENGTIKLKIYEENDTETFSANPTLLLEYGSTDSGSKETNNELFGISELFSNPKPTILLKHLTSIATDKESIILDFFSGSATTAHAVLQLNADDGGNRRFIMVQLPELTDEKSEAYKAGYKNICEIGKERIRRAGKKILTEILSGAGGGDGTGYGVGIDNYDEYVKQTGDKVLDIGFRVLKLDSSNMEDVFYTPDKFEPTLLDGLLDNIKPDRSGEDLLFQVMLDLGIELSSKIERKEVAGKEVFSVDDDYMLACFDTDVDETVIEEMAKLLPTHLVIRDASASSDNVLDNFDQIVESYSNEKKINIHIL